MYSPINCYGGKGIIKNKIIPLLPPHQTYVEVFGGGASILFEKSPSEIEVYIVSYFRKKIIEVKTNDNKQK